MHITKEDIEHATDDGRDPWAVSDGLLYQLCREYPDHQDAKGVTAKMLLIGRAYAATAERGRSGGSTAKSSNDDFYTRDLPGALRKSAVDAQLRALREFQTITEQNASTVLQTHSVLMAVLRELTGLEKRALASKYLHFHLPQLYFIFDSRADGMMRAISPAQRRHSKVGVHGGGDSQYELFVARALALRAQLGERFAVHLTPRQLDRVLIMLHARHAT